MVPTPSLPHWQVGRGVALLLVTLIVSALLALSVNAWLLHDKLERLRVAESDNRSWSLAQLEVDYKSVVLAVNEALARPDAPGQGAVRESFDIFYSRVGIVNAVLNRAGSDARLQGLTNRLDLQRHEMASLIDSAEFMDAGMLHALDENLDAAGPLIRSVATSGLAVFVTQANEARLAERASWRQFTLVTLALLLLMGLSTVLALRLWLHLEARGREAYRAASNLRKAFETSIDAVFVTDTDGRVQQCNSTASKILRLPAERIIGETVERLMIPDRLVSAHQAGMRRFHHTGERRVVGTGRHRLEAMRGDGTQFPAEVCIAHDKSPDGDAIFIAFVRDISQDIESERALRAARDEARRAAKVKGRFLATMSHEMRTPLHGLLAALDLITRDRLDAENRQLLDTAVQCGNRTLAQVNDVLDLTRLGEVRESLTVFRPLPLVRGILDEMRPLARERGNRVLLDAQGLMEDDAFEGLPETLGRALSNLCSNAVKFTTDGTVTIRLRALPLASGQARLSVMVADTGAGIAPAHHERIFRDFETVEQAGFSSGTGTGLGLPIARLAVKRMGGRLRLRSALGRGSVFGFSLRLARSSVQAAPLPEAEPADSVMPGLSVLVVDDNVVNLTLLAEMVRRLGHRTELASNGEIAVMKAQETAFDLVLMDVSMPVMDGIEATRRIRAEGASRRAVILGVTAMLHEGTTEGALEAGMQSTLVKPVTRAQLDTAIRRHWAAHTGGAGASVSADMPEDTTLRCDELAELVGAETAQALVRETIADARRACAALRDETHDLAELVEIVHRAVGSAAVVGLTALHEALAEAERACGSGEETDCAAHADDVARALDAALLQLSAPCAAA